MTIRLVVEQDPCSSEFGRGRGVCAGSCGRKGRWGLAVHALPRAAGCGRLGWGGGVRAHRAVARVHPVRLAVVDLRGRQSEAREGRGDGSQPRSRRPGAPRSSTRTAWPRRTASAGRRASSRAGAPVARCIASRFRAGQSSFVHTPARWEAGGLGGSGDVAEVAEAAEAAGEVDGRRRALGGGGRTAVERGRQSAAWRRWRTSCTRP